MPVNPFDDRPLSWQPPLAAAHGKAVYLALAAALENDIRSGALPPGTKLPPQRELADFLDIDFTTVTRAYGVCREKGLIYGVTGRGTFVAARNDGCADVVDCAVVQGFPETGAGEIAAAAREILSRASAADLFSYRNRDGGTLAIKAGVQWLKSAGVDAAPERTAVFPGAQGAISAALISLFSPGDALAADEFTYANLIALTKLAKIKLVAVAADKGGMSPSALDETSRKHGIRGVFMMPHCANPTGNTLCERRRDALAAVARERDLIIIEDDASLLPPADSGRTMFSRLPERTVYISGSTRYIAPGLRATFMAFPEKFAPRLLDALHHLTIKAGALDTEILGELILSGKAGKILAAKAAKARSANAVFNKIFPDAPAAEPTALFRILPLPSTSGRGREIEQRFRENGIGLCHSDRFCVRAGNPDSFLRISISSLPTIPQLRSSLRLLSELLDGSTWS